MSSHASAPPRASTQPPGSRDASPKRKPQPTAQRGGLGGLAGLASPKFSFRAALIQHKSSKMATAVPASDTSTQSAEHAEQVSGSKSNRPARAAASASAGSGIPSISARTRYNSTSAEAELTSTLPRPRTATTSPSAYRPSSSLGKRAVDDALAASAADSSSISDFGALIHPKSSASSTRIGSVRGTLKAPSSESAAGTVKSAKLRGPPSARAQWTPPVPTQSLPSPSTSKAPRKIARSDGVAEVHAAVPAAAAQMGSTAAVIPRSRTVSAAARPLAAGPSQLQRPKIGTLPKPKPKTVPVRTILDERPDSSSASDSDNSDEEDDMDELEGPDVSRIRTRRIAPPSQPRHSDGHGQLGQAAAGSRIPSIGSSAHRALPPRAQRRSSSNSSLLTKPTDEKENAAQTNAAVQAQTTKRHSISASFGAPGRPRSSLPLAPAPQTRDAQQPAEAVVMSLAGSEAAETALSPPQTAQSGSASLSALRCRGLQSEATRVVRAPQTTTASAESAIPSRSGKQELGIKSSVIQANPVHASILALQPTAGQHQPISTPEALIKAKKRLSGVLLSSASSSSSSTIGTLASNPSPSERAASLARSPSLSKLPARAKSRAKAQTISAGTLTPSHSARAALPRSASRSPIKSSLLLFPSAPLVADQGSVRLAASPSKSVVADGHKETPRSSARPRSRVMSSSEIDADLLASLKVVAHKANLRLSDLLEAKSKARDAATHGASSESQASARFAREASEELEALAGDVSVDLMALDLAASSPCSETSMLQSPLIKLARFADTPPVAPRCATEPRSSDSAVQGYDRSHDKVAAASFEDGVEADQQHDDEATDTSCASPSLRAAAARHPRPSVGATAAGSSGHRSTDAAVETPVRRAYRNVPSIPSTPFPASATPSPSPSKGVRMCPPSAAMSAKSRSRLKKALRESLGLEAHFAALHPAASASRGRMANEQLASHSVEPLPQAGEVADAEGENRDAVGDAAVRPSISALLLTEDDRYLDELVSAVARIGLEDLVPADPGASADRLDAAEGVSNFGAIAGQDEAVSMPVLSPLGGERQNSSPAEQVGASNSEVAALHAAHAGLVEELELAKAREAAMSTQLTEQLAATARSQREQQRLQADLAAVRAQAAGAEWREAKSAWARARVEALTELEDAKVAADTMIVLRAQLGVWQNMLAAVPAL